MLCEKHTSGRHFRESREDRVDAAFFDAERDVRTRSEGARGVAPPVIVHEGDVVTAVTQPLDRRQEVGLDAPFGVDRLVRDDNPHAAARAQAQADAFGLPEILELPSSCSAVRPCASHSRRTSSAEMPRRRPEVRVHLDEEVQARPGRSDRRPCSTQRGELGAFDIDLDHASARADVRHRTDRSTGPDFARLRRALRRRPAPGG